MEFRQCAGLALGKEERSVRFCNRRGGDRLVIKAIPEQGCGMMLNCWAYRDGSMSVHSREGLVLVGPSDEIEQLTLSR